MRFNTIAIFLFTGGLVFIPQKHKEANRVCYNSGIFITSNVYPDFGHQHDNDAIHSIKIYLL